MARRRLNTKVFAILMGLLLVGGAGVFALAKFKVGRGGDPRKLEAQGNAAVARTEWKEAFESFHNAAGLEPRNVDLHIKAGDAAVKLIQEDWVYARHAQNHWREALSADPRFKPALERLLTSIWDQLELGVSPQESAAVFGEIRARAERLVALDPQDAQAQVWLHGGTVRQWLTTKTNTQEEVDKSVAALRELATRDPSQAEAVYYLAMARMQRGQDLLSVQQREEASAAFADAADVVAKALAAGQERNALLQFRAYQVFATLARIDPKEAERKHRDRVGPAILAAAAAATAKTKYLDEITVRAADWQAATGKPDAARAALKAFYDAYPENPRAAREWARVLASKREDRGQAAAILAKEYPLPKDAGPAAVRTHREQQFQLLRDLVLLRLGDFAQEQNLVARAQHLTAADEAMDKLRRAVGNPKLPAMLGLEGRLLLAKDKPIEAVKALDEAYRQFTPASKDYELMFVLAQVYVNKTNQPGTARQLCEEILRDNPAGWPQARFMLGQLLVREGKYPEAQAQIDLLRKQYKDVQGLNELEGLVRLAGGATDPRQQARTLELLPERDNPQRWAKYQVARLANRPEEELRLLGDIVAADPKDVRGITTLVQLYRDRDLADRARELLDRGLRAVPDDPTLRLVKAELDGVPVADLRTQVRERIVASNAGDPYQLQLKLYEFERLPGGTWDAAVAALNEAAKLKPDDKGVHDLLLKEYLARRRFDDAQRHLDKLVALNADTVGGLLYKHKFALAKGDAAAAERIGVQLVAQNPEFAQSWLARAQGEAAGGKWNEAIRSYTEVLARQPTNYEAGRGLVDTYYYAGRPDDAKARLREMRKVFSTDAVLRELYLNHLASFGEPDLAIPEREELRRRNPKDARNLLGLASAYFRHAQRLAADDKVEESKKNTELALNALVDGTKKFPDDARFYAQIAEVHQYNGKTAEAEATLVQFADRERARPAPAKARPDPWLALADFHTRAGQPDKAVADLNEALVRSDNSLDVRLRLVNAQSQARQFAEALRTLDAVRDDADPRVVRQRIEVLLAQGALPEAEKEVRAALTRRDGGDLRTLLASILIDTNRADQAIDELQRALVANPADESARYLRALAYVKRVPADVSAAINELLELKKSARQSGPQARLLLAELYDKTGRRKQGIQELEDALGKAPGNRELRLALIRLYRAERPPRFDLAQELVAKAENDPVLKTDPAWPRESALLYADQRLYQQAVVKMNQAVQMSPPTRTDYRRELVDLLIRFGQVPAALVQTDRLLRDGIDTWWVRVQRGTATARQVDRATIAQAATDPAAKARVAEVQGQALAEFDRALKLSEANPEQTALVLRRIGEAVGYDEALVRLAPRLANDPTNEWRLLAVAMKRTKGDHAGAAADAERLLADPANGPAEKARRVPILRALADVYQTQTPPDFARAKERYVELLKLSENDLVAMNNLAFVLAEAAQPPDPQAAKVYSKAAYELVRQTNDPNPLIVDTHGWVLVLCGPEDIRQGIQILQGVVAQSPNFIEARYHLGEALLRLVPPAPVDAEKELAEALRLLDEEDKLGVAIDPKLRERVQTSLGRVREKLKNP